MNLNDRIFVMSCIFEDLQDTTSMNDKRYIVSQVPRELREDFDYCVECLNGLHKFGYKYYPTTAVNPCDVNDTSIKDLLILLQKPILTGDLSHANIQRYVSMTAPWADFLEPIVNRELKLGIGKSIFQSDDLSVMLAKKFEGSVKYSKDGYYITEKLDGNRCVARWDGNRWVFTSRSGKPMHVNFDMSGLPKEYVYDGEILAPQQVHMSQAIYNMIVDGEVIDKGFENIFNSTSGLINRHTLNKQLVYNIFDIMPAGNVEYKYRREELDKIAKNLPAGQVRVLPVLAHFSTAEELNKNVGSILDKIVGVGGEGVMINLGSGLYTHKRTDALLKYKQVQTMDMRVVGVEWGTGKYEGQIGALKCQAVTPDHKVVQCFVGSGLSDEQRLRWAIHNEQIINKVVEVAYFSISKANNSNTYSLRFPRLKCVRMDKSDTSVY